MEWSGMEWERRNDHQREKKGGTTSEQVGYGECVCERECVLSQCIVVYFLIAMRNILFIGSIACLTPCSVCARYGYACDSKFE